MTSIRRATPADIPQIADVHVRSWQVAYAEILPASVIAERTIERRTAMWTSALDSDDVDVFVAEAEDGILGVASAGPSEDIEGAGEIHAIYVRPDRWRVGVGTMLLDEAVGRLAARGFRDVVLWTLAKSVRSCRFYESRGWRASAERTESFGEGGIDEVLVLYRRAAS